ncbi:hypothetical protein [Labilithrix luteola]|nr:hypothetical protein [Labilithrix luteola]
MRKGTIASLLGVAALVAVCSSACTNHVQGGVAPDPGSGTVTQTWTIEGTSAPAKCTEFGASQMRVVFFDSVFTIYSTALAPCTDFELSRDVRAQSYTGRATFIGPNGADVSETLPIGNFIVAPGGTTVSTVDFPAASLVPPSAPVQQ